MRALRNGGPSGTADTDWTDWPHARRRTEKTGRNRPVFTVAPLSASSPAPLSRVASKAAQASADVSSGTHPLFSFAGSACDLIQFFSGKIPTVTVVSRRSRGIGWPGQACCAVLCCAVLCSFFFRRIYIHPIPSWSLTSSTVVSSSCRSFFCLFRTLLFTSLGFFFPPC